MRERFVRGLLSALFLATGAFPGRDAVAEAPEMPVSASGAKLEAIISNGLESDPLVSWSSRALVDYAQSPLLHSSPASWPQRISAAIDSAAVELEKLLACSADDCRKIDRAAVIERAGVALHIASVRPDLPQSSIKVALKVNALLNRALEQVESGDSSITMLHSYAALIEFADSRGDCPASASSIEKGVNLLIQWGDRSMAARPLGEVVASFSAFLVFYRSSADRRWLDGARRLEQQLAPLYFDGTGALLVKTDTRRAELIEFGESLAMLFTLTGEEPLRKKSDSLFSKISASESVTPPEGAAILLNGYRLQKEPLHITVIAPRGDSAGAALFSVAKTIRSIHKRVEWWDRSEGPMLNSSTRYPTLSRAAAFICLERRCSMPVFEPGEIQRVITEFSAH